MTGAPSSLSGLRVLVTRPAAQAQDLVGLLGAHGAEVHTLPLLAIEAMTPAPDAVAAARAARIRIYTSSNAVRHAAMPAPAAAVTIAVGPATAAALRAQGVKAVQVPARHDSEGVLALPVLADVADRPVALIAGVGGRDRIERTLRARGAKLQRLEVYRRVPVPHPPAAVEAALAAVDAVVISSGEGLAALQAPPAVRARLAALQLVVPSRRVVELAAPLGSPFPPLVPEHMTDVACLHCLEQWWASRRRTSE